MSLYLRVVERERMLARRRLEPVGEEFDEETHVALAKAVVFSRRLRRNHGRRHEGFVLIEKRSHARHRLQCNFYTWRRVQPFS
jgi:hypothetical protein